MGKEQNEEGKERFLHLSFLHRKGACGKPPRGFPHGKGLCSSPDAGGAGTENRARRSVTERSLSFHRPLLLEAQGSQACLWTAEELADIGG